MSNTELKDFWDLIKPNDKDGFVEIRLTPTVNKSQEFWNNCKELKSLLPNTPVNKMVCFFVKTFEELEIVINFKDGWFNYNSKVCYGVQLRYMKKDGSIDGSYESVRNYRFVFFDIDTGVIEGFTKELFDDFLNYVISYLEREGLYEPIIVNSGGGHHLIFRVNETKVTMGRRLWLKEFMNNLCKKIFVHKLFKVDSLTDAPRVAGLVGSFNVKRGKQIKLVKKSDYVNAHFKIKSFRQKKLPEVKISKEDLPNVVNSLEFNILCKGQNVPQGKRNSVLVFFLKMLIRDNNLDYKLFEQKLKRVFPDIDLNIFKGIDNKQYNKGGVINWCKENMTWLKKYPDLVKLYNEYLVRINERQE
jgi:hypothetical protein